MRQHISTALRGIKRFYQGFISGMWIVRIVQQVIVTSGNIAESMFLLATLWVITNAVAHKLLTWFMPTQSIELFNYLAVIAFSALPELILIPTIIVCFTHWSVAITRKNKIAGVWAILYSLPTLVFLVMTVWAITSFVSTGGTHFVPADGMQLVIRCLSGYAYAVINMLFKKLGEPHYASQFEALETVIDSKQEEIEKLTLDFASVMEAKQIEFASQLNAIIEQSKTEREQFQHLIESQNEQVKKLSERASSLVSQDLENYPKFLEEIVNRDVKTVSIDNLSELTGISKRRIMNVKSLQRHSRNKDLIIVSSVIDWLKNQPLPAIEKAEQKHQDTDPIPATNGHKTTQPLEQLVELKV